MELEFYRQIVEKYSNIKFHGNQSGGSRVVPCGRTDRHDEVNCLFQKFANEPKNYIPHHKQWVGVIECAQSKGVLKRK